MVEFGLVVFASLSILAVHIHAYDVRHDFAAISKARFWTMTAAWFAAFIASLAVASVPSPGWMFVKTHAARRAALGVPMLAMAMAVFLRVDAPPTTVIPRTIAETMGCLESCLVAGIEMESIPFVVGTLMVRRAPQPLGSPWIGAALGGAMGTLSALMLHIHCGIGGGLHTGVAHAGQSVIGAVVGALCFARAPRSP